MKKKKSAIEQIERMNRLDDELRRAAGRGDAEAARALIDQGARADNADEIGWTPLMHASASGTAECVEMLLPLSDVKATDLEGKAAFDAAADRDDEDGERIRRALRRAIAEREAREIAESAGGRVLPRRPPRRL
ncbi:ankyrin repeat domain-containing protein [Paraburkholderia flava]|uniref:ankyrin repeat domain-containing protein n=1 Tax=Paraburkholderia flava TaxID=2547393 RepID=UPI0010608A20|nr:ankyrin repeat domain-containing protein [Paraburkholderia flava]